MDGLLLRLIFALIFGLISGGLFALKNAILRLSLLQSRSAPLRYVTFLNEAKDLLFLRQVGGGYIFTHRLLRDYFASLPSQGEKECLGVDALRRRPLQECSMEARNSGQLSFWTGELAPRFSSLAQNIFYFKRRRARKKINIGG
jgi:hypothetical protein